MSNILQFSDRLQKASQSFSELINTCPGIETTPVAALLTSLNRRIVSRDKFCIETVFLNNPSEESLAEISAFLGITITPTQLEEAFSAHPFQFNTEIRSNNLEFSVRLYNSANIPVRQSGDALPDLRIVHHTGSQAPSRDELELIELRLTRDPGIILLISAVDFDLAKASDKVVIVKRTPSELTDSSIFAFCETAGLMDFLSGVRLLNQLQSLNAINTVFTQFLKQQESELKSRKIAFQYDANAVKSDEKINYRDRFQKIKAGFQKEISEIEKQTLENATALFRPSPDGLVATLERKVDSIHRLEEESIGDKIKMRVPYTVRTEIIQEIREAIRTAVKRDAFVTDESTREQSQLLRNELAMLRDGYQLEDFRPVSDTHISHLIEDFTDFSQRYELEKKKLGPTDFFRAGMAPIMTFLSLSTLYMVVGGPGKGGGMGSGLRTVFENDYVRILGIVAIIASLYLFIRKVRKSENHLYDTELEKIKIGMKSEIRNTLKRLSDEWVRSYSSQVREETVRFMSEVENVFSELSEDHRDLLLKNQRSAQRKAQTIEQEDRTFQNYYRNKENFERALTQVRHEINQFYELAYRTVRL